MNLTQYLDSRAHTADHTALATNPENNTYKHEGRGPDMSTGLWAHKL